MEVKTTLKDILTKDNSNALNIGLQQKKALYNRETQTSPSKSKKNKED